MAPLAGPVAAGTGATALSRCVLVRAQLDPQQHTNLTNIGRIAKRAALANANAKPALRLVVFVFSNMFKPS